MSLPKALRSQARACGSLGSPFMAKLLTGLADHWPSHTAIGQLFDNWPGNIGPAGASLPLRLAGGLHALVLTGQDADLVAVYPPNAVSDEALIDTVLTAIETHEAFLLDWVTLPPQTNEVRRSAALIPAAHVVAARFGLPIRLSELGASGGLNLMFDRYALSTDAGRLGPADPAMVLHPDWEGDFPPPAATIEIAERRGVDLNPLSPQKDELRLLAYLWPDQPERKRLTQAAIVANAAEVDQADAIAWLADRLRSPV